MILGIIYFYKTLHVKNSVIGTVRQQSIRYVIRNKMWGLLIYETPPNPHVDIIPYNMNSAFTHHNGMLNPYTYFSTEQHVTL